MQLHEYMSNCSDWKHADLTGEMLRVVGIVDMLDMACAGFAEQSPGSNALPACEPGADTPENGAVEQPQKRGRSTPEQMTIEGASDER